MGVASSFKKNWSDFVKNSLGVSYTIFKGNVAEMVRLSFPFELREVNDADYTITSYITTNSIDRYSTRIVPQGIKLESYEKLGKPVFFNHNFYQLPIGRNLWLKKDERGILAKTQFLVGYYDSEFDEFVRDLFKLYKDGVLKGWSISFIPLKYHDEELNEMKIRVFDEVELLEYSAVTIPGNADALTLNSLSETTKRILEMQEREKEKWVVVRHSIDYALDSESSWDKNKAIRQLRKWAGGNDKDEIDWDKYREGFVVYDEANYDNFGAYKLPHCYVIDGKLTVAWSGVRAAMAAVLGARGGVDIPDDVRKRAYEHLRMHYEEFEKEPPEFRDYDENELVDMFPEVYPELIKIRELENKIEQLKAEHLILLDRLTKIENTIDEIGVLSSKNEPESAELNTEELKHILKKELLKLL